MATLAATMATLAATLATMAATMASNLAAMATSAPNLLQTCRERRRTYGAPPV
jgi:hypothetical protein